MSSGINPMGSWLYIYYKQPETLNTTVIAAEKLLCLKVTEHTQIPAHFLRRPEIKEGIVTWMEVFGPMKLTEQDAFAKSLQALRPSISHADEVWGNIALHCEWFVQANN